MIIANGAKYEINYLSEQGSNESEESYVNRIMNYYSSSTHWICDETCDNHFVTKGKIYPFFLHEDGQEFVIINDYNEPSMIWMMNEGRLLIQKED